MKVATYGDLYEALSYHVWKTGLELIKELEDKDYKAGHMRGTMYVYLGRWEEQKLIKLQKRPLTEEEIQSRLSGPRNEFLRISTGMPKGIIEAELERESGLEGNLDYVPV